MNEDLKNTENENKSIPGESVNKPADSQDKSGLEIIDADSVHAVNSSQGGKFVFLLPLALSVFIFLGFSEVSSHKSPVTKFSSAEEFTENKNEPRLNLSALLASDEFSKNIRDTVYTDRNVWLELRIDQQVVYAHYRDGRLVKYPVSSGTPNASKSIESRPGLFAIFFKTEVHLSSQFNNARMNYFMPFNMGIGFHGLPGTGYYGHLGVRPSSHGCIRMRNEDVRVLFGQCDIGTLVLSHRGKSTRVVAFAPEGFKNEKEYTKDDYMNMLAYNLASLMEGKYLINPPKRFILDGTVIPKIGINVVSTDDIPDKQILPFAVYRIEELTDRLDNKESEEENIKELSESEFTDLFEISGEAGSQPTANTDVSVSPEMVKKYVYNPIGILPYFPPDK